MKKCILNSCHIEASGKHATLNIDVMIEVQFSLLFRCLARRRESLKRRKKRSEKLSNEKTNHFNRGQNVTLASLERRKSTRCKFSFADFVRGNETALSLLHNPFSVSIQQCAVILLQGISNRRFTSSVCRALLIWWGQLESRLVSVCTAPHYGWQVSYLLAHHGTRSIFLSGSWIIFSFVEHFVLIYFHAQKVVCASSAESVGDNSLLWLWNPK